VLVALVIDRPTVDPSPRSYGGLRLGLFDPEDDAGFGGGVVGALRGAVVDAVKEDYGADCLNTTST